MVTELSLTVPIVNTLAFLFTVLGDWWVDKKVISRGQYMISFLSALGIETLLNGHDYTRYMDRNDPVLMRHCLVCAE